MPDEQPLRFESWIDRQVREAIERGEFDGLPGAGKPLGNLDPRDDDWWTKRLVERERLKGTDMSGTLPTSLLLRRERDRLEQTLAGCRIEAEARALVEDLNERIRESHRRRVDGPPIFTATVDVEAVLAQWRQRRDR